MRIKKISGNNSAVQCSTLSTTAIAPGMFVTRNYMCMYEYRLPSKAVQGIHHETQLRSAAVQAER